VFHRMNIVGAAALLLAGSAPVFGDQQYGISTVAGAGCPPDGLNALSWSLGTSPITVPIPSTTNNYFIRLGPAVYRITGTGSMTRVAGICKFGFSGDGGPATSALLNPDDIAADSSGNLLILDRSNFVIRRVSAATGIITRVAGTGVEGDTGDGGPATNAQIAPAALAADSVGGFYLVTKQGLVRYVNSSGVITNAMNQNQLPWGPNNTSADVSISLDGANNLYVTYRRFISSEGKILRRTPQGTITTFAGSGNTGSAGDGGPAISAALDDPSKAVADPSGNLYFTTRPSKFRKITGSTGIITTLSISGTPTASDQGGNILLALNSNRIGRLAPDGSITNIAGNGAVNNSGDGAQATLAQISFATIGVDSIGVDNAGNLYLNGPPIRRVNPTGTISTLTSSVNGRMVVDSQGNSYVLGSTRITKVDPSGNASNFAGNGTSGFAGDGGPAANASFSSPSHLAIDGLGNIYVNDVGNGRLRKIDTTGKITTLVQLTTFEPIGADLTGNFYYTKNFTMYRVTPSGTVTAIAGNGTAAGSGTDGSAGDGGPATSTPINPRAIAGDASGNVFFTEYQTQRIRRVNPSGIIDTIAGLGVLNMPRESTGDGGPATSARLEPNSIAIDRQGNLFVVDTLGSDLAVLIRKLSPIPGTPPSAPTLLSPANNSTNVSRTPTLTWTAVPGATSYDVYFGAWPNVSPLLVTTTTATSYQVTRHLQPFYPYPWRVVAKNASGSNAGSFSPIFTMTTGSGVALPPTFGVVISHNGSFTKGQVNAPYNVVISNVGDSATTSAVSVQFAVSTGLSINGYSGSGWSCSTSTNRCTRPETLAPGASYPPLIVLVNVDSNSPSTVNISATATSSGTTPGQSDDPTPVIAPNPGPFQFLPIAPCRMVDTRLAAGPNGGPVLAARSVRTFPLRSACSVPPNTAAYSLNITAVPRGSLGYVSIWPGTSSQPLVSTLNSLDGRIKANAAIVPGGTDGSVSVYATDATDLIIDVNGVFIPPANGQAFYPLTPCRISDSRSSGGGGTLSALTNRTITVAGAGGCGVPATATAFALNVTVVPKTTLGFLTLWPNNGSQRPTVSTLNALTGTVTANMAIVPAGSAGDILAYATDATELIVDVTGYFALCSSTL
jgi:hypothetical protein